jgi:hypothetical protein
MGTDDNTKEPKVQMVQEFSILARFKKLNKVDGFNIMKLKERY